MSTTDKVEGITSSNTTTDGTNAQTVEQLLKENEILQKIARDNKSAFTKKAQELAKLKASKDFKTNVALQRVEELEELKSTDIDAWYDAKRKLEQEQEEYITSTVTKATSDADLEAIAKERSAFLEAFNNISDITITEDVIANDVPPRLINSLQDKLNKGEISYSKYLEDVASYLKSPKTIVGVVPDAVPNLGNSNGGVKPDKVQPTAKTLEY